MTTIQGGTLGAVLGTTVTTIEGGTLGAVLGTTVTTIEGGTLGAVLGTTVTTIEGGTLGAVLGTTVTTIQGGTLGAVLGTTVTTIEGGTLGAVLGTTVTTILGGVLDTITTLTAISQQNFVEDSELNIPVVNTAYTEIPLADLRRDSQHFEVYSYFVKNQTSNTIDVLVEISPNNTDFVKDIEITDIVNTVVAITPIRFMKYTRVSYRRAASAAGTSTIDVWFNAQG